jgi:pimeloyl-ACP methyl ester carboxylesterase
VREYPVRFEVGDILGDGTACHVSGSVFLPASDIPTSASVVFAIPGGTYTRNYWHLVVDGHGSYSFAEAATGRGLVVIAVDNLGTGESTRPESADRLSFEAVARANAAAVELARSRLAEGALVAGMPPTNPVRWIGVGHSLGGQLLVVQQSRHGSFERIAVLGSSFLGNAEVGAEDQDDLRRHAEATMQAMAPETWSSGYLRVPRELLRSQFHLPDVPAEVLAADDDRATVLPRSLAVAAIASPEAAAHPARISAPIFLAFGERDMSPEPHREVSLYGSSPDVTLFLLSGSAHCHNMAGTRAALWRRLLDWTTAGGTESPGS